MDGCKRKCGREQTENGLREDVAIAARKKRGWMEGRGTDWTEKKRGGCLRDSLAVRRGVIMADGNHSSDSLSPSLTHTSY